MAAKVRGKVYHKEDSYSEKGRKLGRTADYEMVQMRAGDAPSFRRKTQN